MAGNRADRAKGIDSIIPEYRFLKINPDYKIGLALLARHVYSMEGPGEQFPIPGYELINGEETAKILGIEKSDPNCTVKNGDIIYNFDGYEFESCNCKCKNTENITILIKKNGGVLSTPYVSDKIATVTGETLGISAKLAIASFMPSVLFSDIDKNVGLIAKNINELGSGFKAAIYKKTKPDYNEQQSFKYILAFAGSDDIGKIEHFVSDWIRTNVMQGLGFFPMQYRQAAVLSKKMKDNSSNHLIVGHSLGGGLASCAAVISDTKAIVFNPAGLNTYGVASFIENNLLDKKNIEHKLSSFLNPVQKVFDFIDAQTIQTKINAKKEKVTAICSKTDALTNTQNNLKGYKNNYFEKGADFLGNLGDYIGRSVGLGVTPVAETCSNVLRFMGKHIGLFTGNVLSKFIIPATFCEKREEIETDKLLIPKNDGAGHSMDVMLDGLIYTLYKINNNEDITFQERKIEMVLKRQWATESSKITIMYQQNGDGSYTFPKANILKKIENENAPFASSWEKNKEEGRYNVIVKYNNNEEILKKEIRPESTETNSQAKANSTQTGANKASQIKAIEKCCFESIDLFVDDKKFYLYNKEKPSISLKQLYLLSNPEGKDVKIQAKQLYQEKCEKKQIHDVVLHYNKKENKSPSELNIDDHFLAKYYNIQLIPVNADFSYIDYATLPVFGYNDKHYKQEELHFASCTNKKQINIVIYPEIKYSAVFGENGDELTVQGDYSMKTMTDDEKNKIKSDKAERGWDFTVSAEYGAQKEEINIEVFKKIGAVLGWFQNIDGLFRKVFSDQSLDLGGIQLIPILPNIQFGWEWGYMVNEDHTQIGGIHDIQIALNPLIGGKIVIHVLEMIVLGIATAAAPGIGTTVCQKLIQSYHKFQKFLEKTQKAEFNIFFDIEVEGDINAGLSIIFNTLESGGDIPLSGSMSLTTKASVGALLKAEIFIAKVDAEASASAIAGITLSGKLIHKFKYSTFEMSLDSGGLICSYILRGKVSMWFLSINKEKSGNWTIIEPMNIWTDKWTLPKQENSNLIT